MSTRVMDCCWGLQLPPSEKAVLMSLADQANDAGVCWPGVASLSERTCYSERTVQRALEVLEKDKWLRREFGAGWKGSSRYTLNVALLKQKEREREAAKDALEALRQAELDLREGSQGRVAPGDMVTPGGCHGDTGGDTVSPQTCHGVTQTVIEPIPIHTPHTPQASPGGLQASNGPSAQQPAPPAPLMSLADWLAAVQASGQDAVPMDDEVFDYAAAVKLPQAFVALCWREFKRRQLKAGKRQRDWRDRFRECVRCSTYGLWLLDAGQEARLSTKGEQAARYFEAVDSEGVSA